MVFGTRELKYWVLGPSGFVRVEEATHANQMAIHEQLMVLSEPMPSKEQSSSMPTLVEGHAQRTKLVSLTEQVEISVGS